MFIKLLKFWFPPAIYSGMIFYVSSIPQLSVPLSGLHTDKLVHFFEYMPLGFLVSRALFSSKFICLRDVCFIAVVFCACYGLVDEIHQAFVPGRDSSVFDFLADVFGGCMGAYLYYMWQVKFCKA